MAYKLASSDLLHSRTRRRKIVQPKRYDNLLDESNDGEKEVELKKTQKSKTSVPQESKDALCEVESDDDILNDGERKKYGASAYACPDCNKVFRSNATLIRHQRSHTGTKPFMCELCENGFSSAVSLKEHIAKHEDKKLYACGTCSKQFRQNSSYHRHLATHSNKVPFACTICNRQFSLKAYLRSHMLTHTGEKKYKCNECQKAFAHISDLKRHKIIHLGIRPFKCDICDSSFSDKSSRRRHIQEHDKVKGQDFPCKHCPSTFARQFSLKQHVVKEHGSSKTKDQLNSEQHQNFQSQESGDKAVYGIEIERVPNAVELHQIQNSVDLEQVGATVEISKVHTAVHLDRVQGTIAMDRMHGTIEGNPGSPVIQLSCLDVESEFHPIATVHNKLLNESTDYVNYLLESNSYANNFAPIQNTNSIPFRETIPSTAELLPASVQERYCVNSQTPKVTNYDFVPNEVHSNPPTIDYVSFPDFSSQSYYIWLSDFTSLCKLLTFPIEKDLFNKISQVYKSIVDALCEPTGVLCSRTNFKILRNISQDLFHVTNEHLNSIYEHLEQ